jgi:hypothetical protein
MSLLRGRRYNRAKKKEGGTGANQHTAQRAQNDPAAERTAETLAKQHGVSAATIKRDGMFADAAAAFSPHRTTGYTSGVKIAWER